MWAGMLHLAIGNALIGILEAVLIAWRFRVSRRKAAALMILANYFSAWLGGVFLNRRLLGSLDLDLNNGWRWFWIMAVFTYLLTLLLEWPFVALCFRRVEHWFARSFQANVLAQSASYSLLFGWYWLASGTSLYTELHVTSPAALCLPQNVVVYYISNKDGSVYRRPLAASEPIKVCDAHSTNSDDRLFMRPSSNGAGTWDLVARLETSGSREPELLNVLTNLAVDAALDARAANTSPPKFEGTSFNFGPASSLGGATNTQWEFWSGFWPIEGMVAENKTAGEKLHFCYETPFGAWTVRNAVHLPSDKVLFQLGDDQICALDPKSRAIALLWHGKGPVPVIEKRPLNPEEKGAEAP